MLPIERIRIKLRPSGKSVAKRILIRILPRAIL